MLAEQDLDAGDALAHILLARNLDSQPARGVRRQLEHRLVSVTSDEGLSLMPEDRFVVGGPAFKRQSCSDQALPGRLEAGVRAEPLGVVGVAGFAAPVDDLGAAVARRPDARPLRPFLSAGLQTAEPEWGCQVSKPKPPLPHRLEIGRRVAAGERSGHSMPIIALDSLSPKALRLGDGFTSKCRCEFMDG